MSTTTRNNGPQALKELLVIGSPDIDADAIAIARTERYNAAKAEHKALADWRKAGSKGTPPATPNLDEINAEKQSGARPMSATKKNTTTRQRAAEGYRYWHNGKPLADIDNFISRLAYDDTRGMAADGKGTITAKELEALLAEAGITDVRTVTWHHELPNGRHIGGVAKGDKVPAELAEVRTRTRTVNVSWSIVRTADRKFTAKKGNTELGRPVRSAKDALALIAEAGGPAEVEVDDQRAA